MWVYLCNIGQQWCVMVMKKKITLRRILKVDTSEGYVVYLVRKTKQGWKLNSFPFLETNFSSSLCCRTSTCTPQAAKTIWAFSASLQRSQTSFSAFLPSCWYRVAKALAASTRWPGQARVQAQRSSWLPSASTRSFGVKALVPPSDKTCVRRP